MNAKQRGIVVGLVALGSLPCLALRTPCAPTEARRGTGPRGAAAPPQTTWEGEATTITSPVTAQVQQVHSPTPARPRVAGSTAETLEARLEGHPWSESLGALGRALSGGDAIAPEDRAAVARFQLFLAELQVELGAPSLATLYARPEVQAAFVPAWIESSGVALDPAQARRLAAFGRRRAEVLADAARDGALVAAPTVTEAVARRLEQQRALEAELAAVLRPDQLRTYLGSPAAEPLTGLTPAPRATVRSPSERELGDHVARLWAESFGLEPSEWPLAERQARRLVREALADPSPRVAEPAARQRARLERLERLTRLQVEAERALARQLPAGSPQAARARAGAPWLVQVELGS